MRVTCIKFGSHPLERSNVQDSIITEAMAIPGQSVPGARDQYADTQIALRGVLDTRVDHGARACQLLVP
eukprot:4095165-Amphidinium_carterae.1